jgi:hypothetical protein
MRSQTSADNIPFALAYSQVSRAALVPKVFEGKPHESAANAMRAIATRVSASIPKMVGGNTLEAERRRQRVQPRKSTA